MIEKSPEVITLVGSHFTSDERVKIINTDAMTYKPPKGVKFDCVWHDIWHDIWDYICVDNLEDDGPTPKIWKPYQVAGFLV